MRSPHRLQHGTEIGPTSYPYTRDLAGSRPVSQTPGYGKAALNTRLFFTEEASLCGIEESGGDRQRSEHRILHYTNLDRGGDIAARAAAAKPWLRLFAQAVNLPVSSPESAQFGL